MEKQGTFILSCGALLFVKKGELEKTEMVDVFVIRVGSNHLKFSEIASLGGSSLEVVGMGKVWDKLSEILPISLEYPSNFPEIAVVGGGILAAQEMEEMWDKLSEFLPIPPEVICLKMESLLWPKTSYDVPRDSNYRKHIIRPMQKWFPRVMRKARAQL